MGCDHHRRKQGWVNLDEVNNPDQQEGTESGEMSDSTENGKTPGKTDSALSSEDAETSDTAVSVSTEKPETPSAEVSKPPENREQHLLQYRRQKRSRKCQLRLFP